MTVRAYFVLCVLSILTFLTSPVMATSVSITIDAPASNSDVSGGGNFLVVGYATTGCSHEAWITHGGNTYYGTPVAPPTHNPPYQWAFWFEEIPTDVFVTLTAKATYNGSTATDSVQIRCVE